MMLGPVGVRPPRSKKCFVSRRAGQRRPARRLRTCLVRVLQERFGQTEIAWMHQGICGATARLDLPR
eukprot:220747-Pyramimonas_sp.AAC.1